MGKIRPGKDEKENRKQTQKNINFVNLGHRQALGGTRQCGGKSYQFSTGKSDIWDMEGREEEETVERERFILVLTLEL